MSVLLQFDICAKKNRLKCHWVNKMHIMWTGAVVRGARGVALTHDLRLSRLSRSVIVVKKRPDTPRGGEWLRLMRSCGLNAFLLCRNSAAQRNARVTRRRCIVPRAVRLAVVLAWPINIIIYRTPSHAINKLKRCTVRHFRCKIYVVIFDNFHDLPRFPYVFTQRVLVKLSTV